MDEIVKKAIEEYQCSGCISGCDVSCFESNSQGGIGCGSHMSGTFIGGGIGKIFLGMPKGFNRLGVFENMKPKIFNKYEDWNSLPPFGSDKFNINVWKYLNEHGHTLVRGIMPRRNEPFLHIFLEDCRDKINCLEITNEDIDGMD